MDQSVAQKIPSRYTTPLNSGLELFGKNWKKIEDLVETRTGSQIRSHAQKFFLKFSKDSEEPERESAEQESSSMHDSLTVISKFSSETGE